MTREQDIVAAFQGLRIAVIGDAVLDVYLDGASGRICREAPVPVVNVNARYSAPGAAANVARNLASLGARVDYLACVGDDAFGAELMELLRANRIDVTRVVPQAGRTTLVKQRVSADQQLLVRFDQGDEQAIDGDSEARLCACLTECYAMADAVVVSDYGLGLITPAVIARLRTLQAAYPRLLIADARRLAPYCHIGVTAIKPNYEEACRLLDLPPVHEGRAEVMQQHGDRILALTGAQLAAITLDAEGAIVFEQGSPPYRTYGRRVPASQAAGAGDTFVSGLTLALAAGAQTTMATEIASAAAGLVVAQPGTTCCTHHELAASFVGSGKALSDPAAIAERMARHRSRGRRIVFTNGCFDILHRGHVTYLSRAKALGDVLVVGINTDAGVRRLKGPTRPINGLDDRVQVLAALSCVDHIVPFEGNTACELIDNVRPDVYVKGADYAREALPEVPHVEAYGGQIVLLDHLADYSTTHIVERIARPKAAAGELV